MHAISSVLGKCILFSALINQNLGWLCSAFQVQLFWMSHRWIQNLNVIMKHTITEWVRLEEIIWFNLPPQAGPPRAHYSKLCPKGFWIIPEKKTLQPLWAARFSSLSASQQKILPHVQMESPIFQFLPIAARSKKHCTIFQWCSAVKNPAIFYGLVPI